MALGKIRMIEIVRGIVSHSDFFHHTARPCVRRSCEGNDLYQFQFIECAIQDGPRAFGGQPSTPLIHCQTPANLDARSEVGFECRNEKPDEADEGVIFTQLDGIQAEGTLSEVIFDSLDKKIAFCSGEQLGHEFHDPGVGVYEEERFAILFLPTS